MGQARDSQRGTNLETVIVFSERMEELAEFYREGLQLGSFDSSPRHLGQKLGQVYLGFDQVEDAGEGSETGTTLWFTVDDLQATFDRLVSLGAKVRYPPTEKPWGVRLASVHDPDGNVLGLAERQANSENLTA